MKDRKHHLHMISNVAIISEHFNRGLYHIFPQKPFTTARHHVPE